MMTAWLLGLVGGGLLGGWSGARWAHQGLALDTVLRERKRLWLALPLVVGVLVLQAVLHVWPATIWWLPHLVQLGYAPASAGLATFVVAGLCALATRLAMAQTHPDRHKLVLAACLCVGVLGYIQWSLGRSIVGELGPPRTRAGVVLQTTGASCAAASGANVLGALGLGPRTEREVAEAMGTTIQGTTPAQIIEGMRALGADCERFLAPDPRALGALPTPSILSVDHPTLGPDSHAVALIEATAEAVTLWDPLRGAQELDAEQLGRMWRGRGVVCSLGP